MAMMELGSSSRHYHRILERFREGDFSTLAGCTVGRPDFSAALRRTLSLSLFPS
jgi:hypothetical protein